MNKRDFLKAFSGSVLVAATSPMLYGKTKRSDKNVLVLGGTNFVGPSIVEAFRDNGWSVTLLNRGITNPDLFPELPLIKCDREKEDRLDLKANAETIRSTYWDCVVDTWQKSPKAVQDFIDEFKDDFGHYHYISSVSVYHDWNEMGIKETANLNPVPEFPKRIETNFRYAIRKTLAENTIAETLSRYTIYRSHGMRDFRRPDHTNPNEENYWPIRFARGGEILVPNAKKHFYQMTDVKSLCKFIVTCAENNNYGPFNVAYESIPFRDYIKNLIKVTGKPKKLVWIDGDFLIEEGLIPYKIVSAWKPNPKGSYHFDINKALKNGLKNRSLKKLIVDQIRGYKSRYPNDELRFGEVNKGIKVGGFSMEKERELIQKWEKLNTK